jgi:hypothetical protein
MNWPCSDNLTRTGYSIRATSPAPESQASLPSRSSPFIGREPEVAATTHYQA